MIRAMDDYSMPITWPVFWQSAVVGITAVGTALVAIFYFGLSSQKAGYLGAAVGMVVLWFMPALRKWR